MQDNYQEKSWRCVAWRDVFFYKIICIKGSNILNFIFLSYKSNYTSKEIYHKFLKTKATLFTNKNSVERWHLNYQWHTINLCIVFSPHTTNSVGNGSQLTINHETMDYMLYFIQSTVSSKLGKKLMNENKKFSLEHKGEPHSLKQPVQCRYKFLEINNHHLVYTSNIL